MATFSPAVFSVAVGDFRTAVNFGIPFEVRAPRAVEFTDDDGLLAIDALGSTTVRVGEDDQGPITSIEFRTITIQTDEGEVSFDAAFIGRNSVADLLIVPIDRATGRVSNEDLDLGNYSLGDAFIGDSFQLSAGVEEPNVAPVAADDPVSVDEDGSVNLNLLGNDSDPDSDDISVESVDQPTNGSVNLVDGVYVYTPDAEFSGTDTFDYTITDGELTSTATVTVTVTEVNDVPTTTDDTATTDEDTSVDIDVLTNDDDIDSELSISSFTQGENGTVTSDGNGGLRYTPNADFSGTDTFVYAVFDDLTTVSANVTVTINAVNDAPVAGDDSVSTNEDNSIVIDLSALVSDVDSSGLTITPDDPTNGDLTDNEDGTFTYTPDADFNGDDSFTYSVSDGELTDSGSVDITVAAVNDAPVAEDDTASADFETAITINVLENDDDVDSENLTITGITGAAIGMVVISADGQSISYTPAAEFSGEDSFGYILSDGTETDEAAVTVTVGEPGNRAPVAGDDSGTVDEDGSVDIAVLTNDDDPDGTDLTISGFGQGDNGSVVVSDAGGLLYTPDADFNGEDSFTYTVSDGELESTATVNITVNAVNDAPVADDGDAETSEDTSTVINILALISDLDSSSLELEVGSPSNGMIEDIGDGFYRYTPDANFNGNDSVEFSVSDGELVDQGMINIFVEAVNDAPVAGDDVASTAYETAVDINVLENDDDVDVDDDLTVTAITGTPVGQVVIADDGKSVSYTPADGFSGEDSFGYVLSDGTETDTANVTVTVAEPDNSAPTAVGDTGSTAEDTSVAIDVLSNDVDPDGTRGSIVSFTDGANGTVSENDGGELVYTPDANFNGDDSFTYTMTDGEFESSATVDVTVDAVNDAPVADDDDAATAFETAVNILVLENDDDIDEGDDLTVTGITGTPAGDVQIAADGKSIDYTPADGFSGTDSFGYVLSDGTETDSASVTVTVGEADNRAPVASDDDASTNEDTSVAIDVLSNDDDPDGTDPSIASFSDGANGTVAENDAGELVYTPNADFNGDDSFTYTITDGEFESTATVDVTIAAVNDAPTTGDVGSFVTSEDDAAATYDVVSVAVDIDDGDDLTVTAASASWSGGDLVVGTTGTGVSFDPSQLGELLDTGDSGLVTVSYTISDGEETADGSFTINVLGADDEAEPEVIEGGDGNNFLMGGDGDEIIVSGAGAYDRMSGGGGADTFVFGSETSNGVTERDLILDFEAGIDTICLETDDYSVFVAGSVGLITVGEDFIYVRGGSFTLEELENSIQVGCFDDLMTV